MLLAVQWAYRPLHRNNSSVKAPCTKIRSFLGSNSLPGVSSFFIYKNSNVWAHGDVNVAAQTFRAVIGVQKKEKKEK